MTDGVRTPRHLARSVSATEDGKPWTEYTTADGLYRLWRESTGWRRGVRWALRNWPDHRPGCNHGCAPTLTAAIDATTKHREEYASE